MPFAELPDLRLHYRLDGPEDAPVLVFSHSLGADLTMWDPQIPALMKQFRVLRYDTRGHGESSVPSGPYAIEQLARDVLGLLDMLRMERVYFCGLSIGGQTGQWLGANMPQRFHKLVLCNTAAKIGSEEGWRTRIDAVRAGGVQSVAGAVIERWFTAGFRAKDPAGVAKTRQLLETTNSDGYIACCAAVRDFDFRKQAAGIRLPTLVIASAHDTSTPAADGRWLAEQISGGRYVELNAAHLSNIEDSERFNTELSAFLSA